MTKWSWFWLFCVGCLYSASAYHYAQVKEPDLSKNPLFIFSAIVLCGLVLALKMEEHYKSTLLFILTVVLSMICYSNYL